MSNAIIILSAAVLLPSITFALEKLAVLKVPECHFLLQSVTDDPKWKKNGLLYNSVSAGAGEFFCATRITN